MADNQDELDKILDAGLTSYSAAEPLAGMEGRIVERLRRNALPQRKIYQWSNALALGLVTLGTILLIAIFPRPNASPGFRTPSPVNSPAAHSPTPPFIHRTMEARRLVPRVRRWAVATDSKQISFPTPSPLTREERLLLSFARTNPAQTAQTAEALRQAIQPIEIPPITIPPLANSDGQ